MESAPSHATLQTDRLSARHLGGIGRVGDESLGRWSPMSMTHTTYRWDHTGDTPTATPPLVVFGYDLEGLAQLDSQQTLSVRRIGTGPDAPRQRRSRPAASLNRGQVQVGHRVTRLLAGNAPRPVTGRTSGCLLFDGPWRTPPACRVNRSRQQMASCLAALRSPAISWCPQWTPPTVHPKPIFINNQRPTGHQRTGATP